MTQDAETWRIGTFLPHVQRERQLCQVTQLFTHSLLHRIQRELFHNPLLEQSSTIIRITLYYKYMYLSIDCLLFWAGAGLWSSTHKRSTIAMWRGGTINRILWPRCSGEVAGTVLSVPPHTFEKKHLSKVFKINISNFPQIRKILLVWPHNRNLTHRHDSFQILSFACLMYLLLFINTLLSYWTLISPLRHD